jgi:hypothetical protein
VSIDAPVLERRPSVWTGARLLPLLPIHRFWGVVAEEVTVGLGEDDALTTPLLPRPRQRRDVRWFFRARANVGMCAGSTLCSVS